MGNKFGFLNCASGMDSKEDGKRPVRDTEMSEKERELLRKIKECFPQRLLKELEQYNKEAPEHTKKPSEVPDGQQNKHGNDDAYKDEIDEQIERMENFLKEYKETRHTDTRPPLKNFFTVLLFLINTNKDLLEKDGNPKNKKEMSKTVDENKNSKDQQHHTSTKERNEHENNVPAKVQILYTQDGDIMHEILRELKQILTRRIGSIYFIDLKEKSKVDENMLLIIVCIVTTRFGADAKNAVELIKNLGNVALLLIHRSEPHAVTNKNSSLHLKQPTFVHLQGIFDMYFSDERIFFKCDMNDKSVDGLSSFCKRIPSCQQQLEEVQENTRL